MKLLSVLALSVLSLPALAQECEGHLIDSYNRVVQVFNQDICKENLKACGLQARKTGLRCERVYADRPAPRPHPTPVPTPAPQPHYPQPQPQPQPLPPHSDDRLPLEVQNMDSLQMAINFVYEDCYVNPKVGGVYHQLYVRGQFVGNFHERSQEMELRRTIRDYQSRGSCLMKQPRELKIQFRSELLDQAIDYSFARNCHVLPRVGGVYHQLYVAGQFTGNYNVGSQFEMMKLRSTLAEHLVSGRCEKRTQEERQLLKDPNLLHDFINYQYRGCHVKANVGGVYHQLYVSNSFRGNYNKTSELPKLKSAMVEHIMKGQCVFDPM